MPPRHARFLLLAATPLRRDVMPRHVICYAIVLMLAQHMLARAIMPGAGGAWG